MQIQVSEVLSLNIWIKFYSRFQASIKKIFKSLESLKVNLP